MADYKYECVNVRIRDGIGWVFLNRPDKRNAMSPQLHYDMDDALARLEVDDDVKVVVVSGEGGNFQFSLANGLAEGGSEQAIDEFGEMMTADNVIEDDFERPGGGERHQGLDEHGHEHNDEGPPIRPNELAD